MIAQEPVSVDTAIVRVRHTSCRGDGHKVEDRTRPAVNHRTTDMFHKANICLLLLAAAALLLLAGVSATELRSLDEMERSLYNPSSTCATDADCTNYILFKRCRDWGTNLFGITVGFKCSVF